MAQSSLCPHQAFRYGPSVYGLQFHAEMTEDMIDDWLENPANCCELAGLDYIDPTAIRAQAGVGLLEMQRLGDQILPRFTDLCVRRAAD